MTQGAPHRQQGLSLVELLLGLAITALVLAPLTPMFATASNAARITGDQAALDQEASFALARIGARIRATKPPIALSANGTLVEQQGTSSYLLAESVTAFSLSAPVNSGGQQLIQASLSLARGAASASASVTVRMGGQQ